VSTFPGIILALLVLLHEQASSYTLSGCAVTPASVFVPLVLLLALPIAS
jgi:hypothetical protein